MPVGVYPQFVYNDEFAFVLGGVLVVKNVVFALESGQSCVGLGQITDGSAVGGAFFDPVFGIYSAERGNGDDADYRQHEGNVAAVLEKKARDELFFVRVFDGAFLRLRLFFRYTVDEAVSRHRRKDGKPRRDKGYRRGKEECHSRFPRRRKHDCVDESQRKKRVANGCGDGEKHFCRLFDEVSETVERVFVFHSLREV